VLPYLQEEIDIPRRLRQRPRDPRGYPIPYVVLIREDGNPDFRASQPNRWLICVERRQCQLCGQRLDGGGWFIGAPECEKSRRFLDPAMHLDCAIYSLRVCPFLAITKAHYSDIARRPVLPASGRASRAHATASRRQSHRCTVPAP